MKKQKEEKFEKVTKELTSDYRKGMLCLTWMFAFTVLAVSIVEKDYKDWTALIGFIMSMIVSIYKSRRKEIYWRKIE